MKKWAAGIEPAHNKYIEPSIQRVYQFRHALLNIKKLRLLEE
jgi:hypothetical protein